MSPEARELAEIAARPVAVVARLAADDASDPSELLSEAEAVQIAKCSVRTFAMRDVPGS